MKTLDDIKAILVKEKPFLQDKYGVKELGVFGSYVRGRNRPDSDLDILIEVGGSIGLIKLGELESYLEELFGVKVDLVLKEGLRPRIGQRILREVQQI